MSVQALSCAFAIRGISSSEKLVLLALANFANDQMTCWPSQERLAADTELSDRTVWASLKSLEAKRLLSRQSRKRSDGTRSTDVFTLHFALTVTTEPVANSAKATRKSCESHSQILQEPVAAVATLTTFEPSVEPSEEKKPAAEPPGFVEWWAAYPKKRAKGSARKAYRSALKQTTPEILLSALKNHSWPADAKFVPHPATWLNGECWLDATDPPGTDPPQTEDPWRRRTLNWSVNGYWNSDWGPKPDKPGYLGPPVEAKAA